MSTHSQFIDGVEWFCGRAVSTILGIGKLTMYKRLRDLKIFDRDNLPTAQYRGKGLFRGFKAQQWNTYAAWFSRDGIEYVRDKCTDIPRKKEKPYKEFPQIELDEVLL